MSDNHDFYWLEKAEHLLQDGQPTGEPLLDDLAGTVPQARESFEQQLETQLLSTLQDQIQVETMPIQTIPYEKEKNKRLPRGLPVMLAAAVAVLLFGGLSVFFANLPPSDNPLLFSAVQDDPTQPPVLDPAAATATAMIQAATQDAARLWTETANAQVQASPTFVPTSTPLPASIISGMLLESCTEPVPVYEDFDDTSTVMGQLMPDAETRIRVDGTLHVVENDQMWLFITVLNLDSVRLRGWVQADLLVQNCTRQFFLPPSASPIAPMAIPTLIPFAEGATNPNCPPQQLLLYAEPSRSASIVGDLPFDMTLQIEGALTLNMGDNWLLVTLHGVRGWLPKEALSVECISVLAPDGMLLLDKTSATLLPPTVPPLNNDAQAPVVTATPMPSATLTFTPTPMPSATMTPTTTSTHTPVPSQTFTPTPTAYRMLTETVQVRVGDAEDLDLEALVGQQVNIYIAVGSEDDPVTVLAASRVTVLEFVEEPMPNEDRYVFVEAVILPRTEEQLELLAGLAQTGMEMKLEPVE